MSSQNKLINFIDFLSVQPSLYVQGSKRYSTFFGSILSVLSIIIIIVLSIFFFSYFIKNNDIHILFTEENNQFPLSMNLKGKPVYYSFQDIKGNPEDPKAITATPMLCKINGTKFKFEPLETEPCHESNYEYNESNNYKNRMNFKELSMQRCLKQKDIEFYIDNIKRSAVYINIIISRCNNDTKLNNNTCYPPKQIDEYIEKSNLYLSLTLPSVSIDHNNVEYPVKDSLFYKMIRYTPLCFTLS